MDTLRRATVSVRQPNGREAIVICSISFAETLPIQLVNEVFAEAVGIIAQRVADSFVKEAHHA